MHRPWHDSPSNFVWPGGCAAGGLGAAGGATGTAAPLSREQLRQEGSRHRFMYVPPATPSDDWNMDLTQQAPAKQSQQQAEQQAGQGQQAEQGQHWQQAEQHGWEQAEQH